MNHLVELPFNTTMSLRGPYPAGFSRPYELRKKVPAYRHVRAACRGLRPYTTELPTGFRLNFVRERMRRSWSGVK
jgi:hypothetical protein